MGFGNKAPLLSGLEALKIRKTWSFHPPQPPSPQKASAVDYLHLYRHLLRAATYLPDSAAREYVRTAVRYETLRNKGNVAALRRTAQKTGDEQKTKLMQQRLNKCFLEGKKELRVLLKACNGKRDQLEKVLEITYGRRGKTRRVLVSALISSDESSIPKTDEALHKFLLDSGQTHQAIYPSPKLVAFMKSQLLNQPQDQDRAKLRQLLPKVPNVNIWGRPLAKKFEASTRARFWATSLDTLFPPLPTHQWNRLQKLSEGTIPFQGPPPRRRLATQPVFDAKDSTPSSYLDLDVFDQFMQPRQDEWGYNAYQIGDYEEYDPDRFPLTARGMRRIWGNIWACSPKMTLDEATGTWEVVWGKGASSASRGEVSQPSAQDSEFFEEAETLPPSSSEPKKKYHRPKKLTQLFQKAPS